MKKIFLDTETTGLHPEQGHRIIEIAAVAYRDRHPVPREEGGAYHAYINPRREIDAAAQEVHGLDATFLADKPVFDDIASALVAFLGGAELIIHNAEFDCAFLNAELSRLGQPPVEEIVANVTCTLEWSRKNNTGGSHSLDALCDRYGIDISARKERHSAMLDTQLLARLYFQMTQLQTKIRLSPKIPEARFNGDDVMVVRATVEETEAHLRVLENMRKKEDVIPLYLRAASDGETAR